MAGSKNLKNRIRSTKNIKQVTRAMEAVSAVKMRRSQSVAIAARPYALTAMAILREIEKSEESKGNSPLSEIRPINNRLLVVITSDKGLAGAFNTSVIKKAEQLLRQYGENVKILAIGKKGRDYFSRRNKEIAGEFIGVGDFGAISETRHISDYIYASFTEKKFDEVVLVYTNFLSALKQEVVVRTLLPFSKDSLQEVITNILPLQGRYANMPSTLEVLDTGNAALILEPSSAVIMEKLLPELLAIEIFHSILEANASEHSSRMMAMKNASKSASDLVGKLNIQFNKTRQAAITKELSEITAGKEALTA